MKLILEIKDNKAAFFMELLKNFPYVKAKQLSENKAIVLQELKEAVEEVKLAKKGKVKLKSFDDFLNEL